jgi:hypothetical protein
MLAAAVPTAGASSMRHLLLLTALIAACPGWAAAQAETATLNANLSGIARLTLSSNAIVFPDADPDTVPQISAIPGPLAISAKARATPGGEVSLTVQASDDLRSGLDTIPAAHITWTAAGAGFVSGTLSATEPRRVGNWVGSGVRSGTVSFQFLNLWTYPVGTYTLTMTFTLSAA